MKRGTYTNRGGNPQNIFGTVMPLFRLRNCSRALAPAYGALVYFFLCSPPPPTPPPPPPPHPPLRRCVMNMEDLLLIWFMNYLPLTKFHIVNRVWAISTLIITSCCTCHNNICNLFLNGILAGASVSYGHFF